MGSNVKAKELDGVVIADILYDLAQRLHVGVNLTVIDPAADQTAEDAAEVFMTGVGEERAGVGEHTDEVAQNAQIGFSMPVL